MKTFQLKFKLILLLFLCTGTNKLLSQDDVISAVHNKLHQHNIEFLQEKLYLHTDKGFYIAGEILWLKVYNVDGFYNKPLQISKVAYVEIIDKNNKPVEQIKIALNEDGNGGSIQLPLTLISGNYKLRAYTNWMKNFSYEIFFEKIITIVNTLKDPEAENKEVKNSFIADFFPEGGNLVRNIESKVAFKVTNQYSEGVECKGIVTDENDNTVAEFKTLKFGIGNFKFKPVAKHSYKAIITLPDGSTINKPLPAINEYGYVMTVTDGGENINVSIQSHSAQPASKENIFLFVHARQVFKTAEKTTINNGYASFIINKNKLGEGINYLTLFDETGNPLCERLFFIKPKNQLQISSALENKNLGKRQKVNVNLTATTGNIAPVNISIAVYENDSLQQADGMDIQNYLWLTSELAGNIESPGYYFSNDGMVNEATDNLMLSHGWRRFNWNDVLSAADKKINFSPEFNGHIVGAKIINRENNLPGKNVEVFLSIPGTKFQFHSSKTNDDGIAYFNINNYYDEGELILQTNTGKDSIYRIEVLTPFAENLSAPVPQFKKPNPALLDNYHIGMQVQQIYSADQINRYNPIIIKDTLPFYGAAPYTYKLDDYTRFSTMEEVLREYVKPVYVATRNGKPHFRIYDEMLTEFSEDDALILMDGVPIFDRGKIFAYDPYKIKRLDVINRNYFFGPSNFKGLASFFTYSGNLEGLELDKRQISFDYEGLQYKREFYSPSYESNAQLTSKIPDFRTTLFWNPDIQIDKNGKASVSFYTSDRVGNYLIVLQGIDENGNTVVVKDTFEVKK